MEQIPMIPKEALSPFFPLFGDFWQKLNYTEWDYLELNRID